MTSPPETHSIGSEVTSLINGCCGWSDMEFPPFMPPVCGIASGETSCRGNATRRITLHRSPDGTALATATQGEP